MEFDNGRIIAFASDPSINSVIVWLDTDKKEDPSEIPSLAADNELFAISSSDSTYADSLWTKFTGLLLEKVGILRSNVQNSAERELPSEIGLCFEFENEHKFIASHGLHDNSDDFSVLSEDQIAAPLKGIITITYI